MGLNYACSTIKANRTLFGWNHINVYLAESYNEYA